MNILAILFEVYGKISNKQTNKLEIHIKETSIEDGKEYTTESFIVKKIKTESNEIIPINIVSNNNLLETSNKLENIQIEDNYPDMGKILRNNKFRKNR